jgi:hypothetical protein
MLGFYNQPIASMPQISAVDPSDQAYCSLPRFPSL